ncbi:MAG: hypothetical protein JNN28_08210 [Saprospiraceae bacterium]|nr:hypothetical protein [Saprospiraceae bacterium]
MNKIIFIYLLILFACTAHAQSSDTKLNPNGLDSIQMNLRGSTADLAQIRLDSVQSELIKTNVALRSISTSLDSIKQNTRQQSEWSGFWPNAVVGIASSLIGVLGAFVVLYFTIFADNRKDRKKKEEEQEQNIQYFASLINTTLKKIKVQNEHFQNHFAAFDKDPITFHSVTLAPLLDLERLINMLNQDKYYFAYLGKYGNNKESIKQYINITTCIDFFSLIINQIKSETLPNAEKSDHERKVRYKHSLEKGMDFANEIAKQAESTLQLLSAHIYSHLKHFHENLAYTDNLDAIQTQYVNPIKKVLVSEFTGIQAVRQLLEKLKELTFIYSEIIFQNKHHAAIIKSDYESIVETIKLFEENAKELLVDKTV